MSHTFDTCPQRSSSLFVVDPKTHKILLVTKDICDLLGYLPTQLIGHSISTLPFLAITDHRYIIRHESSQSQISLDVCIHLDAQLGVELWTLEPVSYALFDLLPPFNMTVVRLDAYRCIEYTTGDYRHALIPAEGMDDEEVDEAASPRTRRRRRAPRRAFLSLIHADDQGRLRDAWANHDNQGMTYQVLQLRWSPHQDGVYDWISVTMVTHPRRRSYGPQMHVDDHLRQQSMQLLVVRPTLDPTLNAHNHQKLPSLPAIAVAALMAKWASPPVKPYGLLFLGKWILTVIVQSWFSVLQTLFQGQRYLVEFLAHLLISLLDFLADCIDPASTDTASVRVSFSNQKEPDPASTKEVPWLKPLHRKRWATAVRTLRGNVQSNTVAQKSMCVLESIGVVHTSSMFDYLEKVTSENYVTSTPLTPSVPSIPSFSSITEKKSN
ncbi:hypothetical protein BC940DRAFT_348005 [Gongronella butleri]|nr:hypothetical protein BC940DRAFT_348005 [Gongronella butleri]